MRGQEDIVGLTDELQSTISGLAERVGPSVVGIGSRWGVGSGIVMAPGKVATNAHNLRRSEVTVTFVDGRTATGRAAGVDLDGDVAVVDVDTGDLPVVEWGHDGASLGAPVFALSNPGGRGLRVTFGLVSGVERSFRGPRGRRISGSLEHTAPLLPGSSGGPTVDADGRVIGINTNRLGEGFYLAIPADGQLRTRLDSLSKGDAPRRVRLGLGLAPSEVARGLRRAVGLPDVDGLLVRVVEEDSPAARAGVQEGDLITDVDGSPAADVDALYEVLEKLGDGDTIEMTLLRGIEERKVTVTL